MNKRNSYLLKWLSPLFLGVFAYFFFEAITGFALFFFSAFLEQKSLFETLHWVVGLLFLVPYAWFQFSHYTRVKNLSSAFSYTLGIYTFFSFMIVIATGLPIIETFFGRLQMHEVLELAHVVSGSAFLIFLSGHLSVVWRRQFS